MIALGSTHRTPRLGTGDGDTVASEQRLQRLTGARFAEVTDGSRPVENDGLWRGDKWHAAVGLWASNMSVVWSGGKWHRNSPASKGPMNQPEVRECRG